jgi:two-component system, NtrC family, sensor kinase
VNIRSKVAALLAGIFVILGVAALLVAKYIVMPSFAQLERADAHTAMMRIDYALERALDRLEISATDWGNWAETYQYVEDHNPRFVSANLTTVALRELGVNVLLIVDRRGRVVHSSELDLETARSLGLDLTARAMLPADFPWRANLNEGGKAHGLLRTSGGVLMIAAAPVLDGKGRGPSRGMVILGRLLSTAVLQDLATQAQTQLIMVPTMTHAAHEVLVETDAVARIYRTFNDLYGNPVMTLRADMPRAVTERGYAAVHYAAAYLLGAAALVFMLLLVALHRLILSPLALVTRHAVAIGKDKDLSGRLRLAGSDEIAVLAKEFDRMVERVAQSRTQLVDQSYQAGVGELARGVLHNIGNAMTPIGVRLAGLAERLRLAPADDVAAALAELRAAGAEPQRRADLEEFVRLAGAELARTVSASREDVAVMSRQASAIQSMMSEQARTARKEQVIEPVRLTELVAQSLEIVPDACRQRLVVNADETLRTLGVVRVARTVLRLVLQNLIINAADAVRDAGKDRGVLRLSAEIVSEADRQQLHLECQDDGVGIAAQNLERVFEKGFSTKSRETNQGIGLHWCANALSALGGRIWAASDGPGRGASLHLLVPLAPLETASLAQAV